MRVSVGLYLHEMSMRWSPNEAGQALEVQKVWVGLIREQCRAGARPYKVPPVGLSHKASGWSLWPNLVDKGWHGVIGCCRHLWTWGEAKKFSMSDMSFDLTMFSGVYLEIIILICEIVVCMFVDTDVISYQVQTMLIL